MIPQRIDCGCVIPKISYPGMSPNPEEDGQIKSINFSIRPKSYHWYDKTKGNFISRLPYLISSSGEDSAPAAADTIWPPCSIGLTCWQQNPDFYNKFAKQSTCIHLNIGHPERTRVVRNQKTFLWSRLVNYLKRKHLSQNNNLYIHNNPPLLLIWTFHQVEQCMG